MSCFSFWTWHAYGIAIGPVCKSGIRQPILILRPKQRLLYTLYTLASESSETGVSMVSSHRSATGRALLNLGKRLRRAPDARVEMLMRAAPGCATSATDGAAADGEAPDAGAGDAAHAALWRGRGVR